MKRPSARIHLSEYSTWPWLRWLAVAAIELMCVGGALAETPVPALPAWLEAHVGDSRGQIARPVLERARALYHREFASGVVRNSCYLAMDATRPNDPHDGLATGRFYMICEAERSIQAFSAGHGGGRNLEGVANFQNGRTCTKHFGNAMDSNLTMGGAYVTGAPTTLFKGLTGKTGSNTPFLRTFIPFDGEGETDNARARAIGGHASLTLKGVCRWKSPSSPHADGEGYVLRGELIDYTGGRSDGCTSWSPLGAQQILARVGREPTTLYIYPSSADIEAIDIALSTGRSPAQGGLYWNADCLAEIGEPRFWSKAELEPAIAEFDREHMSPAPPPPPVCTAP